MSTAPIAPRKTVLVSGIGQFAPPGAAPGGKNVALAQADTEKAGTLGFDCTQFNLNPDDVATTLEQVKEKLQSQHWDAFLIGFGVRGFKEYTELFEGAVNLCREITPHTRFAFSTKPDGLVEALVRVFDK